MARAHCMAVARDPTTGASLLQATVNVYSPGTVNQIGATMFDKNGNVLSNPLTSDASTGLIDFYLNVAQEVDLNIVKSGFTTRTMSNVPVIDDASFDLTALLTTTGDLPYASANNIPNRLPIGAAGAVLIVSGGVPTWSTAVSTGPVVVKSGAYVAVAADVGSLIVQSAAAAVTLPGASAVTNGSVIEVKATINGASLARAGGDTIWSVQSGVTSMTLNAGDHVRVRSDAVSIWYVV